MSTTARANVTCDIAEPTTSTAAHVPGLPGWEEHLRFQLPTPQQYEHRAWESQMLEGGQMLMRSNVVDSVFPVERKRDLWGVQTEYR